MSTSYPFTRTLAADPNHSPAATWTESDELGVLRAVLEIALEPAEAFDPRTSLFTRIKRNLGGKRFTSSEILAKVKGLRRRYENGGAHGGEAFDISHRIWGLEKNETKTRKIMASSRGKSFLQEEDQILCTTWLEISQDLVMGSNQKKGKLWERISSLFHERISNICTTQRSPKSLSCRMQLIMKAINKFRGCIRQVELLNPSGASELDIIKRARIIFAEDPEERKGFLFDHVWSILKDAEKWANISVRLPATFKTSKSCLSQGSNPSSPVIDLNDDNEGYTHNDDDMSTSRPTGRKKEKMRRRHAIEKNIDFETLNKNNQEIVDIFKKSHGQRENDRMIMHHITMLRAENDKKKLDLQRERQESKIMLINLDTITDPSEREYFRIKKQEILNRNTTGGSSSDIPNLEYSYAGNQYRIPDYKSGGYGGSDLPDF